MAYRNYFRSMFNDNFKILTWVLILFIAITPNFIFIQSARAANLGGWSLSNAVAQGASTVYDATKNAVINGKNFIKQSTVKITPTASQVSKVLARGAAGYALSVAVEQLLGAVDWVLDAENNRILYTELSPLCGATAKFCYTTAGGIKAGTPQEACKKLNAKNGTKYHSASETTCYYNANGKPGFLASIQKVANVNYDASAEQEQKSIPLTTVAQKVISNAEAGDKNAQAATTAAAADIVAEAETDNTKARPIVSQAEANATTKPADAADAEKANEATGTSQPNTANPEATDISLKFPAFCNWAPTVCEAAQTVISFPQTLTNWWETGKAKAEQWATAISDAWTYAKNWATENHTDTESTKVTVEQDNSLIFDDSQRISFSNSCPTPQQFSVSFSGTTQNLEFSYDPLCQFMSMIKPFVVAGSYLIGAYIVMGLSRGSAE